MVGGDDANHGLMSPRGKTQTSSMLKIASAQGRQDGGQFQVSPTCEGRTRSRLNARCYCAEGLHLQGLSWQVHAWCLLGNHFDSLAPARSAFGPPVNVAAAQLAPFSFAPRAERFSTISAD